MSVEEVVRLMRKAEAEPVAAPRYPQPPKPPQLAVSVPDAAQSLGVSVGLLYKEIGAGRIRVVRIAGRTVIPMSELTRIIGDKS
jgi:hypothetical protein